MTAIHALLIISLICATGLALGKLKVGGISLGIAFVFFAGIMAGSIGMDINHQMLTYCETFGLVIFVYTLGLHVGPNFFGSLRHEGLPLNVWSLAVIILGTAMAMILTWVTLVSVPDMVGVLCGATTNTPALGAAQQTMKDAGMASGSAALATAVTYPLGVLGVILAIIILRKYFVKEEDMEIRRPDDDHTYVGQFVITNPGIEGRSVADLKQSTRLEFIISRIWRGKQVIVPRGETELHLYDNVMVVTNKEETSAVELLLGEKVTTDWNREQIDWNHIDSKVESHVIVLTKTVLNGKRLGQLHLRDTYGVNVSRVLRGDIKLLHHPFRITDVTQTGTVALFGMSRTGCR